MCVYIYTHRLDSSARSCAIVGFTFFLREKSRENEKMMRWAVSMKIILARAVIVSADGCKQYDKYIAALFLGISTILRNSPKLQDILCANHSSLKKKTCTLLRKKIIISIHNNNKIPYH